MYGGRSGSQDRIGLQHTPTTWIGTGRIADHLRKETFSTEHIHTLVLDEFDKSLEVGFEADMIEIVDALPNVKNFNIGHPKLKIPKFVGIENPKHLNYLSEKMNSCK